MSFTLFAASVTRDELGLAALDLNDHTTYRVAGEQLMGGAQAWARQSVRSPFVDGEFQVGRTRSNVQETLGVQVYAANQTIMNANIAALIEAFSQYSFQLTLTADDASRVYQCFTADYTVDHSQARMMALQALVTFAIPRSPKLVTGGW